MKFNNYTFNERTRTEYPCGQIIALGMMDNEAAIVSIAGGVAVAYVEDEVIEVEV